MASIDRLAGEVVHDFNNMLLVVLGSTELAMKQVDAYSAVYQDLLNIYKAARTSAVLNRQLLALSRKYDISP